MTLLLIPLFVLGFGGAIWGIALISGSRTPFKESIVEGSKSTATQATPSFSSTVTVHPSPTNTLLAPSTTPTLLPPTPTQTTSPTRTPLPTRLPTATPTNSLWEACPGASLSRLHVDDRAYVAFDPPLANRVRAEPDKNATVLGRIEPGEEVKILDGPACFDNWVWWMVRSKETDVEGWTAEGDFENYWLIPLP